MDQDFYKKSEILDYISWGLPFPRPYKIVREIYYKGKSTGCYEISNGDLLKRNVILTLDEARECVKSVETRLNDVKRYLE